MSDHIEKRCSRCGIVKAVEMFPRDKTKSCGFSSNCKACRKSNPTNPERRKATAARWRKENADRLSLANKEYRKANQNRIQAYYVEWLRSQPIEVRRRLSGSAKRKKGKKPLASTIPDGKKWCKGCGEVLGIQNFRIYRKSISSRCDKCTRLQNQEAHLKRQSIKEFFQVLAAGAEIAKYAANQQQPEN